MNGDRSNLLQKVQALLDKAASTSFDAERDAFIAKADQLMIRHAIEQAELNLARPAHEREAPEVRIVSFPLPDNFEIRYRLQNLFHSLAEHCGVMIGGSNYQGHGDYGYKVVGYRADIDWLQMLFLNIQLHLLSRMEPKPDRGLSDTENFMMLREAGLDYERIFLAMGWEWETKPGSKGGHGDTVGTTNSRLRRMRKAYHDRCKAEGRPPVKGIAAETYRLSFLRGYVDRINQRLIEMRQARAEESKGKELVLASRESDLKEAFFDEYPDRRPHPSDCECDTCHFRKCDDKKCPRPRCKRYWADYGKPVKMGRAPAAPREDHAAYRLGSRVANSADLGQPKVGGSNQERIERS